MSGGRRSAATTSDRRLNFTDRSAFHAHAKPWACHPERELLGGVIGPFLFLGERLLDEGGKTRTAELFGSGEDRPRVPVDKEHERDTADIVLFAEGRVPE